MEAKEENKSLKIESQKTRENVTALWEENKLLSVSLKEIEMENKKRLMEKSRELEDLEENFENLEIELKASRNENKTLREIVARSENNILILQQRNYNSEVQNSKKNQHIRNLQIEISTRDRNEKKTMYFLKNKVHWLENRCSWLDNQVKQSQRKKNSPYMERELTKLKRYNEQLEKKLKQEKENLNLEIVDWKTKCNRKQQDFNMETRNIHKKLEEKLKENESLKRKIQNI